MENEKPKLEKYQKILRGFCFFFYAIALFCLIWHIVHIDESHLNATWIPYSLANVFQYCANWKQNPKTNTAFIVLWGVLFCLFSVTWILAVLM